MDASAVGSCRAAVIEAKRSYKRSTAVEIRSPVAHMRTMVLEYYLQNWAIFWVNVVKYSSTIEHLGGFVFPKIGIFDQQKLGKKLGRSDRLAYFCLGCIMMWIPNQC